MLYHSNIGVKSNSGVTTLDPHSLNKLKYVMVVHPMNLFVRGQLTICKSFQNWIRGAKVTVIRGEDSLPLSL